MRACEGYLRASYGLAHKFLSPCKRNASASAEHPQHLAAMAAGPPQLAGVGDRGSSSSHPPPPPPPKILLAKPPLPPPSSSGADEEGGARARQAPQPGSLSLVSDAWEVHTEKILPVREKPLPLFPFACVACAVPGVILVDSRMTTICARLATFGSD